MGQMPLFARIGLVMMETVYIPGEWAARCLWDPAWWGMSWNLNQNWQNMAEVDHATAKLHYNGSLMKPSSLVTMTTSMLETDQKCRSDSSIFQSMGIMLKAPLCFGFTDVCSMDTVALWQDHPQMPGWAPRPQTAARAIEHYLKDTCGYTLVTKWECQWEALKHNDPEGPATNRSKANYSCGPIQHCNTGKDKSSVLQAIEEGKIVGFTLVDIHTPEELKNKFRDLPPIFKCCNVSQDDIGDHMRDFCKRTGALAHPRRMLISSYFSIKMLISTPLLHWYLQQGLTVTQVYLVIQYQPQECFKAITVDAAAKRRRAQQDPSQELTRESVKLLINSVYGKCCENKAHFWEYRFIRGPAVIEIWYW